MKKIKGNEMCLKRNCSLYQHLRIEPADMKAWGELSEFHYRQGGCGMVDKVFALRMAGGQNMLKSEDGCKHATHARGVEPHATADRLVGVIVYVMPMANVTMRNRATGNRYVGLGDKGAALRLLNVEMRTISRVVIHPQLRGIGLASYLVRNTLGRSGTVMVEAMAAMGKVNPFFERAGMKAYASPAASDALRLEEAFYHVGMDKRELIESGRLRAGMDELAPGERRFIEGEMRRFYYAHSGPRARRRKANSEEVIQKVINHLFIRPIYYLWRRP
jgi:hypothetical protein